MKVKVKDVAVFYNGKRYEKDDSLTIKEDHFDESLFEDESPKSKKGNKESTDEK